MVHDNNVEVINIRTMIQNEEITFKEAYYCIITFLIYCLTLYRAEFCKVLMINVDQDHFVCLCFVCLHGAGVLIIDPALP